MSGSNCKREIERKSDRKIEDKERQKEIKREYLLNVYRCYVNIEVSCLNVCVVAYHIV